jgi:hypothetical protein
MNQTARERILEKSISESDLKAAISKLGDVTEPASFWVSIANDPTYSPAHRAIAICQLFKRHAREPMQLGDLAKLLNDPDWIHPGTVTAVDHLKGELPVEWNLGETVLAIRLFPGEVEAPPVLYLRLSQRLAAEAFVRLMKTPQGDAPGIGASVLEAACNI